MVTINSNTHEAFFTVRVQPRASRTEVKLYKDGVLHVRLSAPPVDGAANEALIGFLAELFDLPKRNISITHGLKGRTKTVRIQGRTGADIERVLSAFQTTRA